MIRVQNASMKRFSEYIRHRSLYIFGAGPTIRNFDKRYPMYALEARITAFVDNDPAKQGQAYQYFARKIEVYSPEQFRKRIEKNAVIIIATRFYDEVVQQLDTYGELDGVECFILNFVEHHYEENVDIEDEICSSKSELPQIPKVIHYCWLGGKPFSELEEKCIASWKKFCPGYEIVRWDENNYDWSKNPFMKKAVEEKVWGYAPDFARIDIVRQNGGFYFDTDVELVRPIEELRYHSAFAGMEWGTDLVNFGQGFGARAHFGLFEELLTAYEDNRKLYDAEGVRIPSPYIQTASLKEHGFDAAGGKRNVEGMFIYPPQYFCARNIFTMGVDVLPQTYSIHHFEGTWAREEDRRVNEQAKKRAESVRNRMQELQDV